MNNRPPQSGRLRYWARMVRKSKLYGSRVISCGLKEGTDPISPANARSVATPEKKLPLDEIIDKINEQYNGAFTDADKVMANAMQDRLMADAKLQNIAKTSDPKIFTDSIFPKYFESVAQECYMESQDAYDYACLRYVKGCDVCTVYMEDRVYQGLKNDGNMERMILLHELGHFFYHHHVLYNDVGDFFLNRISISCII